jgi:NTE family protein
MSIGSAAASGLRADLVCEGGGVKGIGLTGAAVRLHEAGYTFPRIAGTSAGAVVGSVLAALQAAGEPVDRAGDIARTLDYARFRDSGRVGRWLGPLGFLADTASLLVESGLYEGSYVRDWVRGVLADLGVRTFGDLRESDPGSALPAQRAYRLVVMASDLSRQRLVRLPWDYPDYGLHPDDVPVADAVRASASIPFFFEPVQLRTPQGISTLVDGALLSNYPLGIFDRDDGRPARWPTLGIRLTSPLGEPRGGVPVRGPVSLALAIVQTTLEASQAQHVEGACDVDRSVFVDTSQVGVIDFDITAAQQEALYLAGRQAAESFLATWSYEDWRARCAPGPPAPPGPTPAPVAPSDEPVTG